MLCVFRVGVVGDVAGFGGVGGVPLVGDVADYAPVCWDWPVVMLVGGGVLVSGGVVPDCVVDSVECS